MYGHGGIDFTKLCANTVKQVDSVGLIGADVMLWGHRLS